MSKALRASVLVVLLACSARAGWMQNGSPEPPPAAPSAAQEDTKEITDGDSLTEIVLSLLSAMGSLF